MKKISFLFALLTAVFFVLPSFADDFWPDNKHKYIKEVKEPVLRTKKEANETKILIAQIKESLGEESPFSRNADTQVAVIQSTFENLPLITDEKQALKLAGGSKDIIKSNINTRFSKYIFGKYANGTYAKFEHIQLIGNMNFKVHGPISLYGINTYLWIVRGKAACINTYTKNPTKQTCDFFYVTHHNRGWNIDYLIFNDLIDQSNTKTLNAAALVSEPIRQRNTKLLHDATVAKRNWTYSGKESTGELKGYKHGKVSFLKDGSNRAGNLDIMKFSLDDQILIKGYIDHLGIPVREEQPERKK